MGAAFRQPIGILLAAVFFRGLVWMASIPPWQGPDEPSHFGYVQTLAEDHRLPYLGKDQVASEVGRSYAIVGFSENDWTGQRSFSPHSSGPGEPALSSAASSVDRQPGARDKAAAYSPVYYLAALPFYFAGRPFGLLGSLFAIRLFDVLLGVLAVFFSVLAARELWPDHRWLSIAAGVLVAFQPMFSQETGIVSNDAALIAVGAAFVFLALRLLRRFPSWRAGLGLGAVAGLALLIKPTGAILVLSLLPLLLIQTLKPSPRRDLLYEVAGLATAGLLVAGWWVVGSYLTHAGLFAQLATQTATPQSFSAYLHLLRADSLHYLFRAWVDWSWGDFGWLNTPLPSWVLLGIEAVTALLAAGFLLLLVQGKRSQPALRWQAVFLGSMLALGVLFLQASDAIFFMRTGQVLLQGRYLLLAMAALAPVLLMGALQFAPRAWQGASAMLLTGAMVGLNLVSLGVIWQRFYQ